MHPKREENIEMYAKCPQTLKPISSGGGWREMRQYREIHVINMTKGVIIMKLLMNGAECVLGRKPKPI